MGKIKSYRNASGSRTVHYDESGNKVGVSYTSPRGKITHYNADGSKSGCGYANDHGHMNHYDANGNKVGSSYTNSAGQIRHYDNNYNKIGETNKSGFGQTTHIEQKPGIGDVPSQPEPNKANSCMGHVVNGCASCLGNALLMNILGFVAIGAAAALLQAFFDGTLFSIFGWI